MTEEITNLIVEIRMYIGFITAYKSIYQNPDLFREYRIKSIYSSLAIEQNTLSLDQVKDVIDGKEYLDRRRTYVKSKMHMKHMKRYLRWIRMI